MCFTSVLRIWFVTFNAVWNASHKNWVANWGKYQSMFQKNFSFVPSFFTPIFRLYIQCCWCFVIIMCVWPCITLCYLRQDINFQHNLLPFNTTKSVKNGPDSTMEPRLSCIHQSTVKLQSRLSRRSFKLLKYENRVHIYSCLCLCVCLCVMFMG